MSFPLKPFLFLVNRSSALRESYFEECKRLVEALGPIIPERTNYPVYPPILRNWTVTELTKILKVPEDAIYETLLEINRELDTKSPSC